MKLLRKKKKNEILLANTRENDEYTSSLMSMYLQFYFQSLWKKQFQSDPLYNIVASIVRSYVVLYLSLSHARYCKYWKSEEDVRITILQFDYLFNIIQVLGILIWLMIHKGGRLPQPLYRSTVARLSVEY